MTQEHAVSTIKRGKAGEHILIARCLLAGLDVFQPVCEDGRIDAIVGKTMLRIQVKVLAQRCKSFSTRKIGCNSRTNTKVYHYTKTDVDFFAIVDLQDLDVYIVPIEIITTFKSAMSLSTLQKLVSKNDLSALTEMAPAPRT